MNSACENMRDRIAEMVGGAEADAEVRRHLDECQGCREYYGALEADGRMLEGFATEATKSVARIIWNVVEELNKTENVNVDVRRRIMSKDLWKITLAAAVLIIAVVIGRGYLTGSKDKEPVVTKDVNKEVIEEKVIEKNEDTLVEEALKDPVAVVEEEEEVPKVEEVVEADASVLGTPGEGMEPLPLVLPKPMFVGTPTNIVVANLMKPLGRARPPFYAPKGCVNLAMGKVVSSTDDMPIIGEIEMITDGDKEAADGSYVELGPFQQHITVDLEKECEVYAILVWHYHKEARVYFDVIAQTADDADFITNVQTVFNNDIDNSTGMGIGMDMHYIETSEGKLIDAKGVKSRYVRLYSNGSSSNDLNNYIEVEVWGKAAE